MKNIAGIGRVVLWHGGSLWIGRDAGKGEQHSHHAIQISLALDDSIRLYDHASGSWAAYAGALVLPHKRHQFDGAGKSVAQIFVEPETVQGKKLMQRHAEASIAALPAELVEELVVPLRKAFAGKVTNDLLIVSAQQALTRLCGADTPVLTIDPRINAAIAFARSHLATRLTLANAADVAHLSPSRFRHLFMSQTGMTFRSYLLWARIGAAVGEAMSGVPWTTAAQNWGFADSAHLSRTCRRMFGIAPSALIME